MLRLAKPQILGLIALLSGVASTVLSSWLLGLYFLAAVYLNWQSTSRTPWNRFVYQTTRSWQLAIVLGLITTAAAVGGLGYWLVRPAHDDRHHPHSLAAIASRFARWGLIGAAMDATFLALLLVYRWSVWGWP